MIDWRDMIHVIVLLISMNHLLGDEFRLEYTSMKRAWFTEHIALDLDQPTGCYHSRPWCHFLLTGFFSSFSSSKLQFLKVKMSDLPF